MEGEQGERDRGWLQVVLPGRRWDEEWSGIVLIEAMRDRVLAVERTCDRVMRMKLEIEGEVWHIISCYAPQVGCTQEGKYEFWEHMDAEMQAVPRSERLVVAGDLNGHVGRDRDAWV